MLFRRCKLTSGNSSGVCVKFFTRGMPPLERSVIFYSMNTTKHSWRLQNATRLGFSDYGIDGTNNIQWSGDSFSVQGTLSVSVSKTTDHLDGCGELFFPQSLERGRRSSRTVLILPNGSKTTCRRAWLCNLT